MTYVYMLGIVFFVVLIVGNLVMIAASAYEMGKRRGKREAMGEIQTNKDRQVDSELKRTLLRETLK